MEDVPRPRSVRTSDGCCLATYMDGAATGPVVVLSSSLGTSHEMWAAQVSALAPTHRVLRYDSRGHGASEAPAGDYTIGRMGQDVLDILDAYGLERVSFAGLSMGGMVGQWLGANAPLRLERLVLANTASSMGPASSWNERIARVQAGGMAAIADAVLARWFTPGFTGPVVARLRAQLLATSAIGYAGGCAAIRDLALSPGSIHVPTLIIAGGVDPATPPERSYEIARAMPRMPEVISLAAAHLSNLEQPAAFNRALLEFLS